MLESGRNWELFGYDMRNLRGLFLAAWRDLLWDDASPLRRRLDEPVAVRSEQGEQCYQGGRVSAAATPECSAVLLPENLVLSRTVTLPRAVEGSLENALAFEIRACSPFSAVDTGYGWCIVGRDSTQLRVCLAIVSVSAVMAYLGRHYDVHVASDQEVWAQAGDHMILVHGFGEGRRRLRYRARLLRAAAMVVAGALLLLAIIATSTLFDRLELQRLRELAASAESESGEASRMRAALARANSAIAAVNQVAMSHPSPHRELARLTSLLGDDAYLDQFSMTGTELNLRGRAVDAAAVMEVLSDVDEYAEVTAPRAITRVASTGLEQFYLSIRLRTGAKP